MDLGLKVFLEVYQKNDEIILTEGNSKAYDKTNIITASNLMFDKINNILSAENNVNYKDKKKDTIIPSSKAFRSFSEKYNLFEYWRLTTRSRITK